jgi:FkbM family methyltransferase
MSFINIKDVQWRERMTPGGAVKVPTFMDVHGTLELWEKERFASMQAHLKPGMCFWDIGAYDGWQDAVISRFVGGAENMVLAEPEPRNWGNIKATFEANGLGVPLATYLGLVGAPEKHSPVVNHKAWPGGVDYYDAKNVDYTTLIDHTTFRHIDENDDPTISLDTLFSSVKRCDAINVDVEGAGMIVLQSGENLLRDQHPLIWVSIHGRDLFHHRPIAQGFPPEQDIPKFLEGLGYTGTFLADDHEQEWLYECR